MRWLHSNFCACVFNVHLILLFNFRRHALKLQDEQQQLKNWSTKSYKLQCLRESFWWKHVYENCSVFFPSFLGNKPTLHTCKLYFHNFFSVQHAWYLNFYEAVVVCLSSKVVVFGVRKAFGNKWIWLNFGSISATAICEAVIIIIHIKASLWSWWRKTAISKCHFNSN